jgi:multidrug resistance efflux pump
LNATIWWKRAAWVLAALVATTAAMAHQQIATDDQPARAPLSDTYPGLVRPRDVTTIALPTSVVVRKVLVVVGDHVRPDQTLLSLDDEEARKLVNQLTFDVQRAKEQTAQIGQSVALLDRSINALALGVAQANAELAIAQRNVERIPNRQLKDSPERAQVAYDQAVTRERRLTDLAANGVVPRQDLEDARFAVRMAADDLEVARRSAQAAEKVSALQALQARAQADLAMAEQRRQRAERSGDLAQARLRQAQTEAGLAAATARLTDLTVRAPGDSLVAEVGVRAGDRVLAGAPLIKLATVDPMVVDVDVPPSLVNALHRGDAAVIRVLGLTDDHRGRILTIAPLPGAAGAHTLEVEFGNPSRTLLAGQTARVRFSVGR